jgi:outer membrane immunogenic protein
MKSFLLATVGIVALVGIAAPASAADMAVKAPPPAPLNHAGWRAKALRFGPCPAEP